MEEPIKKKGMEEPIKKKRRKKKGHIEIFIHQRRSINCYSGMEEPIKKKKKEKKRKVIETYLSTKEDLLIVIQVWRNQKKKRKKKKK